MLQALVFRIQPFDKSVVRGCHHLKCTAKGAKGVVFELTTRLQLDQQMPRRKNEWHKTEEKLEFGLHTKRLAKCFKVSCSS
jgi:NADH:ubiquinone oxidoreductase subunit E